MSEDHPDHSIEIQFDFNDDVPLKEKTSYLLAMEAITRGAAESFIKGLPIKIMAVTFCDFPKGEDGSEVELINVEKVGYPHGGRNN